MFDFTLTEQQESMREMAHDFAEQEIRPVAWEYDKDGTWPEAIIDKAWELGLMNSHLPERYGGAGVSYLEGCLIGEELAWGCAAVATTLGANDLATAHVRGEEGRQVPHQRIEVLHHQRRLRRLVHGLRQDGQGRGPPRHLRFCRAQGRHDQRRQA